MEEEVKNPEAVLAELRRAQEDLKAVRAENNELRRDKEKAETALEAANSAEPDEWKTRALHAETKLALGSTGIKDVDRLMKYVGTEGLDFDDDGKVTGLDERLKTLKTDLPELFDPKRRVGGRADIFADESAEAQKDPLADAVHNALHG